MADATLPPEQQSRPYLANSTPSRDKTRRSSSVSFAELESSRQENAPSFSSRYGNQGIYSTPLTSTYFDNGEPVKRSSLVSTPIYENRMDQQNVSDQSDRNNNSFSFFESLKNTNRGTSPNMATNVSPIANVISDDSDEELVDYMKSSDDEDVEDAYGWLGRTLTNDDMYELRSSSDSEEDAYEWLGRTLAEDDVPKLRSSLDSLRSSSESENEENNVDYVARVDRAPLPLRDATRNLQDSIGKEGTQKVMARLDLVASKVKEDERRAEKQRRMVSEFNNRTMVDQIKNVVPRDIGHMSTTNLYEDQTNTMKQNNFSIINPMLSNNISLLDDIDIHQLNKNLRDFPLAAELFRNKRVTTIEAEDASYMKQLNDELQESKTSLLADRVARKGDNRSTFRVTPKPAYRFEASTRPKFYKGL